MVPHTMQQTGLGEYGVAAVPTAPLGSGAARSTPTSTQRPRNTTHVLSIAELDQGLMDSGLFRIAPGELAAARVIILRDELVALKSVAQAVTPDLRAGVEVAYARIFHDLEEAQAQLERLQARAQAGATTRGRSGSQGASW